ncbi:1851_t:CDS:1, partial [Racocetra persica]
MSPRLNSPSEYRRNTTKACDSCRRLKIRCKKVAYFVQSTKCSECMKRNYECVYSAQPKRRGPKLKKDCTNNKNSVAPNNDSSRNEHQDDELFCGLSQEEIKLVSNLFKPEQLPHMLDILTSTSSLPCPYENIA